MSHKRPSWIQLVSNIATLHSHKESIRFQFYHFRLSPFPIFLHFSLQTLHIQVHDQLPYALFFDKIAHIYGKVRHISVFHYISGRKNISTFLIFNFLTLFLHPLPKKGEKAIWMVGPSGLCDNSNWIIYFFLLVLKYILLLLVLVVSE